MMEIKINLISKVQYDLKIIKYLLSIGIRRNEIILSQEMG